MVYIHVPLINISSRTQHETNKQTYKQESDKQTNKHSYPHLEFFEWLKRPGLVPAQAVYVDTTRNVDTVGHVTDILSTE